MPGARPLPRGPAGRVLDRRTNRRRRARMRRDQRRRTNADRRGAAEAKTASAAGADPSPPSAAVSRRSLAMFACSVVVACQPQGSAAGASRVAEADGRTSSASRTASPALCRLAAALPARAASPASRYGRQSVAGQHDVGARLARGLRKEGAAPRARRSASRLPASWRPTPSCGGRCRPAAILPAVSRRPFRPQAMSRRPPPARPGCGSPEGRTGISSASRSPPPDTATTTRRRPERSSGEKVRKGRCRTGQRPRAWRAGMPPPPRSTQQGAGALPWPAGSTARPWGSLGHVGERGAGRSLLHGRQRHAELEQQSGAFLGVGMVTIGLEEGLRRLLVALLAGNASPARNARRRSRPAGSARCGRESRPRPSRSRRTGSSRRVAVELVRAVGRRQRATLVLSVAAPPTAARRTAPARSGSGW